MRIGARLPPSCRTPRSTSASVGPVSFSSLTPSFSLSRKPWMSSAEHHAAVAHVVEPFADHQRRRRDALERPVVGAARFELRVRVLPQELAGRTRGTPSARRDRRPASGRAAARCWCRRTPCRPPRPGCRSSASRGRPPTSRSSWSSRPSRGAAPSSTTPCCGRACRPTSASRRRSDLRLHRHGAGERRAAQRDGRERRAKSSLDPMGHGSFVLQFADSLKLSSIAPNCASMKKPGRSLAVAVRLHLLDRPRRRLGCADGPRLALRAHRRRWAGSRRAASGGTRCRASTRTAR